MATFVLVPGACFGAWWYQPVTRRLRERGWLVPAYTFPANRTDLAVLRVVCRNGFTHDLAALLVEHLEHYLPELKAHSGP